MNNNQNTQRQSMATSGSAVKQRQLVCEVYLIAYHLWTHAPNPYFMPSASC